ncbi:MAG: hypothetical protein ACYS5V_08475 [Planctomycetota bacterium]|jgi:hypothetical protein
MFRKIAAALAGAMICLPVGGNLHVALGTGTGHFHRLHLPSESLGIPEQMIVYPCLLILTLMLSRHQKHTQALRRH